MGGLVAAIELAALGLSVTLLEKEAELGGKMRAIELDGRPIDVGPTVLTMRWVFDELFATKHRAIEDYVTLEPLEILARHVWPDGSRLDLFADLARSEEAIGVLSGSHDAAAFRAFMRHAARTYQTVEGAFLRSQKPTVSSLARGLGAQGLRALAHLDAHRSMWSALSRQFRDPRLVQLFARYATYVGGSPFETPATFNLIAHVEATGVSRVRGGMVNLAEALGRLASELGVVTRTEATVTRMTRRADAVTGCILASGERFAADAIVWDGDAGALACGVLDEPRAARWSREPDARSLSAFTMAIVGDVAGFPLAHHNVCFSADYQREFREIFEWGRAPEQPTVYICAPDHGAGDAQRLFLIVNAPANGAAEDHWSEREKERCATSAFRVMQQAGLSIRPQRMVTMTPVDFARRYPGSGGAIYGERPTALSMFERPGARTQWKGLYLTGGTTHPGPGVPMAALSGKLVARAIAEDLDSMRRSSPAGTVGSTWTG